MKKIILFAVTLCIVLPLALFFTSSGERHYTCAKCNSTKTDSFRGIPNIYIYNELAIIKYRSPSFEGCQHIWNAGISFAVETPTKEYQLVLVRKDHNYGAFILFAQQRNPEITKYKWWYRLDGKGIFKENDGNTIHGSDSDSKIAFGPFLVEWSYRNDHEGYIYYHFYPGDHFEPSDLHICVTDEKEIHKIDASDSKWLYKASPVD